MHCQGRGCKKMLYCLWLFSGGVLDFEGKTKTQIPLWLCRSSVCIPRVCPPSYSLQISSPLWHTTRLQQKQKLSVCFEAGSLCPANRKNEQHSSCCTEHNHSSLFQTNFSNTVPKTKERTAWKGIRILKSFAWRTVADCILFFSWKCATDSRNSYVSVYVCCVRSLEGLFHVNESQGIPLPTSCLSVNHII